MLSLANGELSVALLDPANPAEQARQGTRYCWGGYVWRVSDADGRDLLAGPQWPQSDPTPFNGQGIPESFRHMSWPDQRPLTLRDGHGFILGVGDTVPGPDGSPVIARACPWEVTPSAAQGTDLSGACPPDGPPDGRGGSGGPPLLPRAPEESSGDRHVRFLTRQAALGWECELVREVSLQGRTVTSRSRLANLGRRTLPLHWFAHPFFALGGGTLSCDLPPGYGCEENPGFAVDPNGRLTFKRKFAGLDDGHFQLLRVPPGTPLRTTLSHPLLEYVKFETDFVPDLCPVWGNGHTWSIEPYIMTTVEPGQSKTWTLKYEFGPNKRPA